MVNGRLEFSYELGSGPAQITTRERVNDGKRHQVVARRTTRHGSLELDGIRVTGISPEGNHQMLNTQGNIYIGKISHLRRFEFDRWENCFFLKWCWILNHIMKIITGNKSYQLH